MADKRSRERLEKLSNLLEMVKAERDNARDDLAALRTGIADMLGVADAGADELAVGLALLGAIMSKEPGAYAPHVSTLAASARVDESTVLAALDLFQEAGVLTGESTP